MIALGNMKMQKIIVQRRQMSNETHEKRRSLDKTYILKTEKHT